MNSPAAFQATYSDWKLIRSRKTVQIVLEIPLEAVNSVLEILGGMPNPGAETWVAVARLNGKDGEAHGISTKRNVETAPASSEASTMQGRKPVAPDKRLTRRAAMACDDPVFQRFLYEHEYAENCDEQGAVSAIYRECKVSSRKDIVPGTQAAEAWDRLWSKYLAWKVAA